MATEKNLPLATFGGSIELPEHLKKWPCLRSFSDLNKYAEASKEAFKYVLTANVESASSGTTVFRGEATKYFYKTWRTKLGQ